MRYHEKLNIIFMPDKGPRHSIQVRRSRFYLCMAFFVCLPFICILLALQCWRLWEANTLLRDNVEKFEADYQKAENRAERLEALEALLQEENVAGREILYRQLAESETTPEVNQGAEEMPGPEVTEGPGHEEFPVVDTGRVTVGNVQIRTMRGNILRIGLDLRNPDPEQPVSGKVRATLITAAGDRRNLNFVPQDVGNFKINRFKRTVMNAHVPRGISLVDSQIILEVQDNAGQDLYRNIYSVQQEK